MIAINQKRCYRGSMYRNVTMLFLAFAVLFGSIHALPWSHGHIVVHEHAHNAAHDDYGDADLGSGDEEPAKKADASGDIGHQHSMPMGVEGAGNDFDASDIKRQSVSLIAQTTIPPSYSRAPPTQPPQPDPFATGEPLARPV